MFTQTRTCKGLLFLCGTLVSLETIAAPCNPTPYMVNNQGEEITIQHLGDEHYNYYQTTDGYLIDKAGDGCYYYLNESGELSNVKVSNQQAQSTIQFLGTLNSSKAKLNHKRNHPMQHVAPASAEYKPKAWATGRHGSSKLKSMPVGKKFTNGTNLRFPVLLVAGSGTKNCSETEMINQLNQEGYSKNNHNGSVKDYFKSVSNGMFDPYYDVYSVSVSGTLSSYKDNEGQLVKEAIAQLKNSYPDFNANQYDSDNDGEIDAVAVLYAGTEKDANKLGGFHYELQWNKEGRQSIGNKKFNSYLIISQMESAFKLLPICTFVHEFSHCMGLKDHYSVRNYPETFTTQFPGTHGWDVMSTGMYNNGGGCPPGYSAFEKEFMGWITPTALTETDGTTVVEPLNQYNKAYKLTVNENECFYIENRQLSDWDASLPNHGMLIWHIDYNKEAWDGNVMNDVEDHQRIDVVEAGNLAVTSYYDGFEKDHLIDDPYPGSQNVTSFSRFKSGAGQDLGIKLYQITEANNNIYFTTKEGVAVNTNETSNASLTETGSNSSTQEVIVGDAIGSFGYTWDGAENATVTGLPNGVTVLINTENKTISISGTPTEVGIFNFTVATTGATTNAEKTGCITVIPKVDSVSYDFNFNVRLILANDYTPSIVSIDEVLDSLGVSNNAQTLYDDGSLKEYAIEPDGAKNSQMTAIPPGQWFDADGNVCEYAAGIIFAEYELSSALAKIGHYPGKVGANDDYTVKQAFSLANKIVNITYHISTIDSVATSSQCLESTAQVTLSDNKLELKSLEEGAKVLKVYDTAGRLICTDNFEETDKTVEFGKNGEKRMVFVCVEGEKQAKITIKGVFE